LGTIKALELLVDVADGDTKIIPGHGVISNAEEVQAFLDMLLVIYDERWESGRRIGSSAALLGAAYADMAQR
jgi:hypothetical protein